jgi:GntR family transcriptional repressor for pyruvate dehydrogenase complex
MRRLEDRGLVEAVPGRGRFVTSPDLSSISRSIASLLLLEECSLREVMEVRRILEVGLAELAAATASDERLEKVDEAYQRIGQAGDDLDQLQKATREFHIAVAHASGNHLGQILVAASMQLTSELRLSKWARGVDHVHLHQKINDALKRRDPIAARQALSEHHEATRRLTEREELPRE